MEVKVNYTYPVIRGDMRMRVHQPIKTFGCYLFLIENSFRFVGFRINRLHSCVY